MFGQQLARPPDQPRRRLVARRGEQPDVAQRFVTREPPPRSRHVVELGVQQFGHEIVGRVLHAPVDVLLELGAGLLDLEARLEVGHLALVDPQALVDAIADRFLVLFGDAEQHADRAHGHLRAQIADEVEAAGADQRIEAARAEGADLGFECGDLPRREHARQQAPVDVVLGRVLEDDRAGRYLEVALDQLEHRAAPGDVRLPVDRRALDVVEAAQREEVVALVVIEGLLVAEPLPDRIRVGVDLEVVRVVVEIGAHCILPASPPARGNAVLFSGDRCYRTGRSRRSEDDMPHFTKAARGTVTGPYPGPRAGPVSYQDSISAQFYEREGDAIFGRTWLNVGRVEQLSKRGSFFTKELDAARTSVIVVRGM